MNNKLYITENTTTKDLTTIPMFKFHDSSVCFEWDTNNSGYLYVYDMDDSSHNIFAGGDFSVLHKYDVDVKRLKELLKGEEVIVSDLTDTHDIPLEDIPHEQV